MYNFHILCTENHTLVYKYIPLYTKTKSKRDCLKIQKYLLVLLI